MKRMFNVIVVVLFLLHLPAESQYVTKYPGIPRIDVHTHMGNNYMAIDSYLASREQLLSEYKTDLAMWINLNAETAIDTIAKVSDGRIVTCIGDYIPYKGLTHKPADIKGYLKKGYVGYKIWYGTLFQLFTNGKLKEGDSGIKYFYLDDPHHEPVLSAMEKAGMVLASVHIADPNGPFGNRRPSSDCFCPDPVEFWRAITGLERVLQSHPKLVVVAAHGAWLMVQDAHLDYLRFLFRTYPNFYVDLAATGPFHLCNRENLRDLFIEYSDHILFGTDSGKDTSVAAHVLKYSRSFQFLETNMDKTLTPGGLELPQEVLENIYYKNAIRIYPGLSEKMKNLGYNKL